MRIGMFLDNDFPPDSRVENEAVSLIDAGHEVFLFSISYEGRQAEENINGIQVRRYTGDQWLYKSSAMAYQLPYFHRRLQPRIEKFIQENKLEALHIHDMPLAQAVINVNDRSFHLPLTLDLHENRPVIMQHYKHLKTFPGKYIISPRRWEQKQEELIKKADHVIVVTEEAKNHYTKTYKVKPSKFIVTPNTIHPEIFLKYPTDIAFLKNIRIPIIWFMSVTPALEEELTY